MDIISSNSKKVKYFLTNYLKKSKNIVTKPVKKIYCKIFFGNISNNNSNQTDFARQHTKNDKFIKNN